MGNGERNQHINQCRNEYMRNLMHRRHILSYPEQDCRHITDGRPRTAGIGCNNHHTGIFQPVGPVGNQLTKHRHNHDRCRQVIQQSREEESGKTDIPQQFPFVRGADISRHRPETTVFIDNIDNQHGTHHKEQGLCHISQMVNDRTVGYKINKLVFCRQICHFGVLHQKLFEQRIGTFNENVVGIKHQYHPQRNGHKKSCCRFVDLNLIFKRNSNDTPDKNNWH